MKKYAIIVCIITLLVSYKYLYAVYMQRHLEQKIGAVDGVPFEMLISDSQKISTLYPSRVYPYQFVALFIAVPNTQKIYDTGTIQQGLAYVQQGIPYACPQQQCTSYYLPWLIATSYYVTQNDVAQTLYYMQLAKTAPDAPESLDGLISALQAK